MVGPLSGQELLPARELVPDAHAAHTLDPVAAAYVPAAHEVQNVVALLAYEPSGQGVHPALVADGTQYVPLVQQIGEPVVEHWPLGVVPVQPEVVQVLMALLYSMSSSKPA